MKVTVNRNRILHLILLILCSHVIARVLIKVWEWPPLSAYGLGCTMTIQFSNAIIRFNTDNTDGHVYKKKDDRRARVMMKRMARKNGLAGTKRK